MSTVCSGCCQKSKSVTFWDFRLSQGSIATCCRRDGNICDVYIENFLTDHLTNGFWKSVYICRSYCQTSRGLLFWDTVYNLTSVIRHSKLRPAPCCKVLPSGEFNGVIPEPLTTIAVTVFAWCCQVTKSQQTSLYKVTKKQASL